MVHQLCIIFERKAVIVTKGPYHISTNQTDLNIPFIHGFLSQSYWAENIPVETVQKSIANSLCFGVYESNQQAGFARVVTDYATFGYLADVFIDENYRGLGLSKWLMEVIMGHPALQKYWHMVLPCRRRKLFSILLINIRHHLAHNTFRLIRYCKTKPGV